MREGYALDIEAAYAIVLALRNVYSSRDPLGTYGLLVSSGSEEEQCEALATACDDMGMSLRYVQMALTDDMLVGVSSIVRLTVMMAEHFRVLGAGLASQCTVSMRGCSTCFASCQAIEKLMAQLNQLKRRIANQFGSNKSYPLQMLERHWSAHLYEATDPGSMRRTIADLKKQELKRIEKNRPQFKRAIELTAMVKGSVAHSVATEVTALISVAKGLQAGATRNVALRDINGLIGRTGDPALRRWSGVVPEYCDEALTAENFAIKSKAILKIAKDELRRLRSVSKDVRRMMYVPSLAQSVLQEATEGVGSAITGQAALKVMRPSKMAATVIPSEDTEPDKALPTRYDVEKSFGRDYLGIDSAVVRDARRSWRWYDNQPARPCLAAAPGEAMVDLPDPPYCAVAMRAPYNGQGSVECRLGVVYNCVLEADADPEYAVGEVVAVGADTSGSLRREVCTVKRLSPYSRSTRRSNIAPVALLDNSRWQHCVEPETAIDCASVACIVNLWEAVTQPGDPTELWLIDAEGLRDAKPEVVGHMEWLSEK